MRKLLVLFPGIGYSTARPLLYYAKRMGQEKGYEVPSADELIKPISLARERAGHGLMAKIAEYPSLLTLAAKDHAPHMLCYYLKELAAAFHTFYNAERVVIENDVERNARLALLAATRQVLGNGLALLASARLNTWPAAKMLNQEDYPQCPYQSCFRLCRFLIGVVTGCAICAAAAVFITNSPIPFVEKFRR